MVYSLPQTGSLSQWDFASILSHVHHHIITGRLRLQISDGEKTIAIENSRIQFVSSTMAEDQFENYLRSTGRVADDLCAKARSRANEKKIRLGRALLELQAINHEELWDLVTGHLQHIVFSLFPLQTGQYEFLPSPEPLEENITWNVDIPLVILEGIRKMNDRPFIQKQLAHSKVFRTRNTSRLPDIILKPFEGHVLEMVEKYKTVSQILKKCELLPDETLKILYLLNRIGFISDRDEERRQPATHLFQKGTACSFTSFREALNYYNAKYVYIFKLLHKEIGPVAPSILLDSIREILENIPVYFQNIKINENGGLDEDTLAKTLWHLDFEENVSDFIRGLEEILFAEIFAVKKHLGRNYEKLVLQCIREIGN